MKQKLLTDIELDVHELKYLMESFSKESTQTLSELLKRSITRMQGHLDELLQDVDTVCESLPPSPIVEEYKESDTFVVNRNLLLWKKQLRRKRKNLLLMNQ